MPAEMKQIKISIGLYKVLEEKGEAEKFESVDEYAESLLVRALQHSNVEEMDPDEEEEVKRRLEQLGYL